MQTRYAIVGARFRPPAQQILEILPAGTKLLLVRQPDNPYDAKAVAVMWDWHEDEATISPFNDPSDPLSCPIHLGFIPAKENAEISNKMDIAQAPIEGILTFSLSGGPMIEIQDVH